jgi:predicted alpha/beta-hydrolase family hydrolase
MRPYVKALQARNLTASAIDLPKSKAERAVPVFIEKVPAGAVAGGHSYGGRVASIAAIEARYAALVLLSYPLHRPGHPEDLRTEHWPKIECPVLLLSGESDPFARVDLLRSSVRLLRQAELVTFPGVGHGLLRVIDAAMDRVAEFVRGRRS